MATVEELLIKISANTELLQRELKKAEGQTAQSTKVMQGHFDKFDQATARLGSTLRSVFGAAGIGFGVAGLTGFLRSTIDAVGGLAELAEQLGVGTQALQVYQHEADQSGLRQESLNAFLARFTRTIGDAAEGNDKAIETFRKLGVGILDANGKLRSGEDILADFAQALARVEDPAQRAAIVTSVGGREAQKALPFLAALAGGYEQMAARATAAGAVLQDDLIKRFDEISDAMARNSKQAVVWGAQVIDVFARLGGPIASALRDLDAFLTRLDSTRAQRGSFFKRQLGMTEGMDDLFPSGMDASAMGDPAGGTKLPPSKAQGDFDAAIERRIRALQEELKLVGQSDRAKAISKALSDAANDAEAKGLVLTAAKRAQIEATTAALYDATAAETARAELMKVFTAQAEADEKAEKERLARIQAAGPIVQHAMDQEIKDLERRTTAAAGGARALEVENELLAIRNQYMAAGVKLTDAELEQRRPLAERTAEMKRHLDEITEAERDAREAGRDVFHVIGTGMEDAIIKGNSLRDILAGVAEDIQRIILRVMVTKPLENALSNALGGGWDSLLSSIGGYQTQYASSYASAATAPAFAEGGRPDVGMPSLVGERGPELFVPDVAGTVISNGNLRRMGGDSVTVVQQISIHPDVSSIARLEIARQLPTIGDYAKSAVLTARRRGGSYGRGLVG